MMVLTFSGNGSVVKVRVDGSDLKFADLHSNFNYFYPIEFLKMDLNGILKEFPDLEGLPDVDIKKKAIERFKGYIKDMTSDEEIKAYIVRELGNCGYALHSVQKNGFRTKHIPDKYQ